jgi:hypothetical protein
MLWLHTIFVKEPWTCCGCTPFLSKSLGRAITREIGMHSAAVQSKVLEGEAQSYYCCCYKQNGTKTCFLDRYYIHDYFDVFVYASHGPMYLLILPLDFQGNESVRHSEYVRHDGAEHRLQ